MAGQTESLADVKRQATIDHILAKVRRHVVVRGVAEATMDQLAEAADVSRRTLFRLFDTRERLIAEAFAVGMDTYFDDLPRYDGQLQTWLRATCETAHHSSSVYGPGYWELTSRPDLPPDLKSLEQRRRKLRRRAMTQIAATLWLAENGRGEPPEALVAAVGAHLSPHFTAAVMTDVGHGWKRAAALAYESIMAALRTELANAGL